MKRLLKTTLSTVIVLSLFGCSTTTTSTQTTKAAEVKNEEFAKFTDECVVKMVSSDFTTVHQYFEHPENYGIDMDTVEVSLGNIETTDEDIQEIKDMKKELESFNYEELDATEQDIYDELEQEFTLSLEECDEKYDYTGNIWGSLTGIHESMVSFYSEYELRNEDDIKDLITLINDTPRYINEALDYTKKQAEEETLCFDCDTVLSDIQEIIDSKDTSSIKSELASEVDELDLDETKAKDYKQQINDALDQSFFPAYQTMEDTLSSLKDQVLPITGLANLENGKGYYELLIQNATGSSESVEEIRSNLQDAADLAIEDLQNLYYSNQDAYYNMDSITTGYSNVEDILTDLSKVYTSDFPEVSEMNYELRALSDDQSTEGVVAYFMIPPIDNTATYQIRYNERDYGKQTDDVDLFTVLAHEGIAGHMYQAQYNADNLEYTIQYLFNNDGFSEGYATYVEFYSLNYVDYDSDTLQAYKLNEILMDLYIGLMDISVNYDGLTLEEFEDEYSDIFSTGLSDIYNQLADNPTVFLSYYYGYLQIMNLRSEAKKELGDKFNNVDFNNALLKAGSVNFDIVTDNINEYIEETK